MRKVSASKSFNLTPSDIWNLITDLNLYPRYIKFVESVSYEDELKLGSVFYDKTKIVWFPVKIKHKVDIFEKNKKLGFFVKMPLGGKMYQRVKITADKSLTNLDLSIEYTLGNTLFNAFGSLILSKRLKEMLESILDKGNKDFNE